MAISAGFTTGFQEESSMFKEEKPTLVNLSIGYYHPDNLKNYQNHTIRIKAAVSK